MNITACWSRIRNEDALLRAPGASASWIPSGSQNNKSNKQHMPFDGQECTPFVPCNVGSIGNCGLDDLPYARRSLEVDVDLLKELIEDPRLTTQCLAKCLEYSHITVETHLHELGKAWKYGVWISHDLLPY